MTIFTWRQRVLVLAVNALSLALFLSLGIWIDRQFSIKPFFLILGLIASFAVGQAVLAKVLVRDYQSMKTSE